MKTWRDHLDSLSEATGTVRVGVGNSAAPSWYTVTAAEAAYRVLEQYRLAGMPGLDTATSAPMFLAMNHV